MDFPDMAICTSPGFCARPPGIFSVDGMTAITLTRGLSCASARIAPSMAAPPAMSNFIFSMSLAGLMEIPPVSKVMALPTSPSTGAPGTSFLRRVGQHNHSRRLGAAARHGQQRAHLEFRDALLVEDVDAEPGLARHGHGAFGEQSWRQQVRRLVAQFAREVLRFRDDASAIDAGLRRGVKTHQRRRIRPGRSFCRCGTCRRRSCRAAVPR